jgi:sulfane dehydrogenase subunit SoxC
MAGMKRRGLLQSSAALAVGGGATAAFGQAQTAPYLPPNVPEWTKSQGAAYLTPPYGVPSKFEKEVIRRSRDKPPTDTAAVSRSPIQNMHGIVTANGLIFERHHAGVPEINPNEHRLMLHGLVERPLLFSMEDLLRFPSVSKFYFLECSGNSSSEWRPSKINSVQLTHGLLACCEWTGVPLSTLLAEVGVQPNAEWILAEGADGAAMTRSIPLKKALDDALIAYAQNGEMLRPEQGYPVRLLLPGYEGNMSVKWLRRLKVGDKPWYSREETSKYTMLQPDGKALEFVFEMDVKSVVTFPNDERTFKTKGFYEISGLAWSGRGQIAKVDVSVDGGRNWKTATLQDPVLPKCLTRFRLPFQWQGQPLDIQSRAMDSTGDIQPTREKLLSLRGPSSTYHYNAIQGWKIAADGGLTNANA